MALVMSPGACHCKGPKNATDILARFRLQEKVKVIRHDTILEELERIPGLGLRHRLEKGLVVVGFGGDVGSVIAAVQRVID
jgi:hypothetical protein